MAKKLGRPTKPAVSGERAMLGLRVRAEVKGALETAAEASGRSQSQEAEFRLERSFETQALAPEALRLAYGPELAGLLTMLGATLNEVGNTTNSLSSPTLVGAQNWMDNPYAYDQAVVAANRLFEALRPEGDASVPATIKAVFGEEQATQLGAGFANSTIDAVARSSQGGGITEKLKRLGIEVSGLLGASLTKRIQRWEKRHAR